MSSTMRTGASLPEPTFSLSLIAARPRIEMGASAVPNKKIVSRKASVDPADKADDTEKKRCIDEMTQRPFVIVFRPFD